VSNETPIAEGFNPSEDTDKKEITIDDCFDEFKKPEILDEDNMWYCSKCKEHV
jgi:ubiquitin carboxyl-terminal hydrolase 4/11/15